jgi:hypothetical protein
MKFKLITLMTCLLVFAFSVAAQNSIKLFDAVSIDANAQIPLLYKNSSGVFGSRQVTLSCPTGEAPRSQLTGPGGGWFVVDNIVTINRENACGVAWNCYGSTLADPLAFIGEPVLPYYSGVAPMDVSNLITKSGTYTFELVDFGYTFGSTDVYLNTTCSIGTVSNTKDNTDDPSKNNSKPGDGEVTQICHRDFGKPGQKTLSVGPAALAAHLSHGDVAGPCGE